MARVLFNIMFAASLGDTKYRDETRKLVLIPQPANSLPNLINQYRIWRMAVKHAKDMGETYPLDTLAIRSSLNTIFEAATEILPARGPGFRVTSYRAQLFIDEAPTIKSLYDYSDFVITTARRALQRQPELGKIIVSVGVKPTDEKQKAHGKAGAAPSYAKNITCYNCGEVGHISPNCTGKRKESTASATATPAARDMSKVHTECKHCGLKNHDAKDCHHRTSQCSSCHKIGHVSRICSSSGSNNRGKSSDSTDKKEGGAKKAHKAAAASDAAEKPKGGKSKGKGRPGTAKWAMKTAAVAAAAAGAATTQALVLEHQVMMDGDPAVCGGGGP